MRSNWIIIMVFSGLKNQSQCWKGLTVPGPYLNVQRKVKCGNPLSCCSPLVHGPLHSSPGGGIGRNHAAFPAKQLRRGRAPCSVPAHGAGRLGMATKPRSTSVMQGNQEPRGELGWGHPVLGAAGTVDPAPRAVQGQVKPRNAWLLLLGGKKDCSYYFL